MHFVRESSLQEYAAWYLQRAAAKGDTTRIPVHPEQRVAAMRVRHEGKMREWFTNTTRWHIVEFDLLEDLTNLVFLECDWTRQSGLVIPGTLNYRLLSRVADNAIDRKYMAGLPPDDGHRTYYDNLQRGAVKLAGKDRIAICSAEPNEIESSPAARYYLLDGVGRCLPYMLLLLERKLEAMTIEAFLAER